MREVGEDPVILYNMQFLVAICVDLRYGMSQGVSTITPCHETEVESFTEISNFIALRDQ